MQLLIISSLKSVSRYVSYREARIAIRIVSWGDCIVAALDEKAYKTFNFFNYVIY